MVNFVVQVLGLVGGDLLVKCIGLQLGVDDIGVFSNEVLGGIFVFIVGKYFSLWLYLSYGVGLFEFGQVIILCYCFSKCWNFEVQNVIDFSCVSFNYWLEKQVRY